MSEQETPVYKRRPVRATTRASVWDRSGGACHYCDAPLHRFRNFTIDHVVPIVRGGTNHAENLVACYRSCNAAKNAQDADGFRARRQTVRKKRHEETMDQNEDRFLTVEQVASRLQVHEETVRRWLRERRLRGHLISRRAGYRVRASEVDRFASGDAVEEKIAA